MRILSVDDRAENLYLIEAVGRAHGFQVASARNGLQALEELEKQPFDLIISDILMPEMDGFQLCHEVKSRERTRHIPFIFYTATYTARQDEELGLSLGASRYVVKPVEPGEFAAIIEEVVSQAQRGGAWSPEVEPKGTVDYLKAYNARLVSKLDHKIEQLERARSELQASLEASDREIAQRQRAEEKLRRYSVELAEANEDLRRFTRIVSHDLRAPLVSLKGFSSELRQSIDALRKPGEALLANLPEPERAAVAQALQRTIPEALGFIESSVTRMDHLTAALLRLSRAGRRELHMEELDTGALVQGTVDSLAHRIERRNIAVEIGPLPRITSDRAAVERIFEILLDNATKYLDPHRPPRIEVSAVETADEVVFRVRDTGRGIAEEDMDKIFQPFRRAGVQDVPGEGMGLAFVRALLHRLGGRIECHSQLGVGTTFSFLLPKVT